VKNYNHIKFQKVSIILILLYILYTKFYYIIKDKIIDVINKLINPDKIKLKIEEDFINKLNNFSIYREPKYILLFDYIYSPICEDLNAFTIFEYYRKKNIDNAYYVLNDGTDLYKSLSKQNKTRNIIPFKNNGDNNHLFQFLLNSKIIIQSYSLRFFQKIASEVKYLKFLYICHAVNYFKTNIIKYQLLNLDKRKQNIILTSPYEYNLYKKLNLYDEKSMYKAGLARYDRLNNLQKNVSEKNCILLSFTYRDFNNYIYQNSLFKKNTNKLLNDEFLNIYLEKKNIDLVFIPHHHDVLRKRKIGKNFSGKIKFIEQKYLSHYIKQCSLFITDFSSISFDFMFQNKPVLFYHLDINDSIRFKEKSYMKIDYNNSIYYNNVFVLHEDLVNKIKFYIERNFTLEKGLKEKYLNMFYYKNNITSKIVDVINNIIKNG